MSAAGLPKVDIYTDGACRGNPGPGGWGAVLLQSGAARELCGGHDRTTNQRMELTAAIEALRALNRPHCVRMHSDSAYLVNAFRLGWIDRWQANGWRTAAGRPVENEDLWKQLLQVMKPHRIKWIKVAGHAGNPWNERADELARQGARGHGQPARAGEPALQRKGVGTMTELERVTEAAEFVASRAESGAHIGLILGSGLGDLANRLEGATIIPYPDIPHFVRSTVPGHRGRLLAGRLGGTRVWVMQGRFHYYEGYSMAEVVRPVRVLGRLGVTTLIVTNAAGGLNPAFRPGDLMLIEDHINLVGANPLVGPNEDAFGPRFPDMTEAYDSRLRALAREVAGRQGVELRAGVYLGLSGPTFETPAEIRAFRTLGADAVGMSTVPEVIAARHMGVRVLGISCITNMAAGLSPAPLTHEEVIETTARAAADFERLVTGIVTELGR
ncbi:MAG: purine-nucleoside phosphorylase [Firmicutes bacterium]|nr:purine-nucleoside phosphorylase [Bacillota bacterium]